MRMYGMFTDAACCTFRYLIETMRREGYELQVGQPQVIYKEIDGKEMRAYRTAEHQPSGRLLGKGD
jgi:hypothetical protein